MSDLLETTLKHLRALVAFDTRNPPRAIGTDGIFDYLCANLHGFDCRKIDHGAGAVSLHSVRGKPKRLFNIHLDTVPDSPHWSASPFELRVDGERAVGLGACDIKGAAAALLAAASSSDGDAAFLFTSDEEANDARCIAAFLVERNAYETVIVAEPTRCEAVLAHRGISSVRMHFEGRAGHASRASATSDSAVHQAARWSARALAFAEAQGHARFGGLTGLRFNIGRIEGGIKANVIAPAAEVRFGFRPLPSMDTDALLATLRGFADPGPAGFSETFRGPPLPAGDIADAESKRLAARDAADALGIPIGNAVDFWTEASLFSHAGYTTFVFGPGDIAEAHSADEFVALAQLDDYARTVTRLIADRLA
ncbi:MAG TPA: acetylornithine deacetylase [Rhodanobacteraceae bacterium]|nr:acetylornithine deacetylase [Rhodanobacteraceae bacterium]